MKRLPPSSTRTDPHFPSTALVRSEQRPRTEQHAAQHDKAHHPRTSFNCTGASARGTRAARHANVRQIRPESVSAVRSEEHTSELQSLMRISYAVFRVNKITNTYTTYTQ